MIFIKFDKLLRNVSEKVELFILEIPYLIVKPMII